MRTTTVTAELEALPKREHLRLLICGDHDLGRLNFATSFPSAVIVDASGTLYERDDRPDVPILRTADLETIEDLVRKIAGGFIAPETLVIDGFPYIAETLEAKVKDIKGYDNYAAKCERYTKLIASLRALPCHLVVVTRIRQEFARPGSVFGGRLVTDTDRIIVGTGADIHKTLLEFFDVVFEVVRGNTGRAMAAVKTSVLAEIEADEVIVPDGGAILARLMPNPANRATTAPTPQQYATYLRLKADVAAIGIDNETLGAIRRLSIVAPSERTSPYLSGDEIEEINVRFIAYLAGADPTALEPVAPPEDAPPVDAAVACDAESKSPAPAAASADGPREANADPAPTSNVVALPARADEAPARPSVSKPEWLQVKERLTSLNRLLDEADRPDEKISSVTEFLRRNQLFAEKTAGGQILCTTANALDALRMLDEKIASVAPLELPVAS